MRSLPVAYLLWALFGVLGVHRFYLHRIGTGLLWLFTGGLLGIGWLVDAFLIPGMVEEINVSTRLRMQLRGDAVPLAVEGGATGPVPISEYRIVYCTQCGSAMQVPFNSAGRHYACPHCRTILRVPA